MYGDFAERCYDAGFKAGYQKALDDIEAAKQKRREEDRAMIRKIIGDASDPQEIRRLLRRKR